MPLINKQPFVPDPIPDNLSPDDEVFYHELTNEIFTSHDAFFDRFLYCNSLIWTCGRTGKSGLTYKEALDSERREPGKKKKGKRESPNEENNYDAPGEVIKKKKKKYPYDPKKYSMPVPEGFDPSLLTPTGKIDGRKLKSKKNKQLAEELLSTLQAAQASETPPSKKGKHKKKDDSKENEAKKKEDDVKKKAQLQAELAKEKELEAKRKKEAAALAKQLERQKKEEERKKATTFLQNWEKKCEDLERDDLKRLPQPTPLICDLPAKLFGDAIFILESLYNLHDLYNFIDVFPEGITYDILEEMLLDRHEDGPLGTLLQFLLRLIIDTQPKSDGYGLDDDITKDSTTTAAPDTKQEHTKVNTVKSESTYTDGEHDHETNGLGSEPDEDDENVDVDKDVKMNDLIGSAIRAAQEVKKSLTKPLSEIVITEENVIEVLKLHLLQSGSFPKGRTIYNGWYSSREDPGLWLCMQEPDLIKKLGEVTIYDLEIEERIKILHTLIYQLFSFIKTRMYIESASEQLTELRKSYRSEAAAFARWDRENCVKRMQPPKRKGEQGANLSSDKQNGLPDQNNIKFEHNQSNPCSVNGDTNHSDDGVQNNDREAGVNQQLKSCLKTNGSTSAELPVDDADDVVHSRKKITFKTGINSAIGENGLEGLEGDAIHDDRNHNGSDEAGQSFEEQERAYQQNMVDYEDYQRERAIRYEHLNESLLLIRTNLRNTQSVYGVHPIGRDRAYRRYWLFQSLPGLFVEQDDDYLGCCLQKHTPLESTYEKLFNKENPLRHPNEDDLIKKKTHKVDCSTESKLVKEEKTIKQPDEENGDESDNEDNHQDDIGSTEITDEMNYCTGNENTCAIHGLKRPTRTRWWFYHKPESVDGLIESLNKRGYRESELHDVLQAESSIIKPWVADCPAYKLNRHILGQSGIRRSRRLRTKGSKRRGRNYD